MVDGKKSRAEQIVYEALDMLAQRTGKEPVAALEESVKALTPVLEVRSRRVGGATYQVPVEVPAAAGAHARRSLADRVRPQPAREDDGRAARRRAARRPEQQGGAFKRKDDIYRMAQANKAFAHYRW